jgi:hypothetical protein
MGVDWIPVHLAFRLALTLYECDVSSDPESET